MAIKLGGGGGGSTKKLTASTATVGYDPVSPGTRSKLDENGNLTGDAKSIYSYAYTNDSVVRRINSSAGTRYGGPHIAGEMQAGMPDGTHLTIYTYYVSSTYGFGCSLNTSSGEEITSITLDTDASYYNGPAYSLEYLGEDSTNYLFSFLLTGTNSNNTVGTIQGGFITRNKSTDALTSYLASGVSGQRTSSVSVTAQACLQLKTCRNHSAYISMINPNSNNSTIEIRSGTLSSSYTSSFQTTTTYTDNNSYRNMRLLEYDNATGHYLLAYFSSDATLELKKIIVAADGSHTVSDITVPSSLSSNIGTGSSNFYALYSWIHESEAKGKYLISGQKNNYELVYQKLSYDGSSLTAGPFQSYYTGSNSSANYLFNGSQTSYQYQTRKNLHYSFSQDRIFLDPQGTHSSWGSSGATWVLGSAAGSVTDTATKFTNLDSFYSIATMRPGTLSKAGLISQAQSGSSDVFVTSVNANSLLLTSKTEEKVAIVRQAGITGDTVNISLVDGITSEETLDSSSYLNKEDMYYAYEQADSNPVDFTYYSPGSTKYVEVSTSTLNNTDVNAVALTLSAPPGKLLRIQMCICSGSSQQQVQTNMDGTKVGDYIISQSTTGWSDSYFGVQRGAGKIAHFEPLMCKTFEIIRNTTSTHSYNIYIMYDYGELKT